MEIWVGGWVGGWFFFFFFLNVYGIDGWVVE